MSRVKRSKRLVNVIHVVKCIVHFRHSNPVAAHVGMSKRLRTFTYPILTFVLRQKKDIHTVPKLQTQALLMKRKFMEEFFLIQSSPVLSLS